MLPERVQVPEPAFNNDVMLTTLLFTILPAISAPPAPVPCRVRNLLPAPEAVKLLVNLSKPDALLAVIVALPVVPAMLMVRFVVCPVPVKVKAPADVVEPRWIVVPMPAALATPWSPIEETVTPPPPTLRFPVKELASLSSLQRPPAVDWVTATLPPEVPSEIRPVISFTFEEDALVLIRIRVWVLEVAFELILPPITNLFVLLGAVLLIVKPPYIKSGALMLMVVLLVARPLPSRMVVAFDM